MEQETHTQSYDTSQAALVGVSVSNWKQTKKKDQCMCIMIQSLLCPIVFCVEAVIGYADFLSCVETWRAEGSILMTLERERKHEKEVEKLQRERERESGI